MITIYNSNLDFDLNSSNSITLSSTSNMVFKTNGTDKMSIVNNGISVSGNVVVSGLITSTGAGFSGIGANLTNIPISAINELRLELNGGTTELSVTRDTLNATIVSEARFGSNYTNRINSELNTRVDNTSNYVLATSNILIGRIINTSNYVDSTNNFLSGRIDNTSNYVLATSNILIGRLINTSNYVDSTSNFLGGRLDNTSNYVFSTSNVLIGRIINTSNYVDSTSNFLGGRIDNTSNYVFATSNILIGRVINASNYVESTSNILIGRLINASNYVDSTSNLLAGRIDNTSNYVFATSNILIGRIINTSNYVLATSNILADYNNLINKPFQINGANIFNNSGNVGIGTNATPLSLMEIITANYTGALLTLDAGIVNSTTQMPRSIGRPLLKLGKTSVSTSAGDYYGIGFGNSPTLSDYNCAEIGTIITSTTGLETGDIIFSTRPSTNNVIATERMRITSTGNVGIGTTDTTTYKLNVGGTLNTTGLYVNGTALTTTFGLKQDILTSTNTIGVFNTTTDFVVNGDKIELTKNTSNYVIATSNLLSSRIDSTSNYSDKVGGWGSNYAYDKVGVWSSNYSDRVGGWGSNYAYDKVGLWSSNYTDRVGGWGSNYAYDKVGMYSSNYTDRIGERSSNYVLATSNILIGRIVHTSNYVSSYKPATAVRADTADKFTTSRRIANVPFDGSADISISYNSLDNKLNAIGSTGINIDVNNNISATYASTDLISIFNTTDFADVNSKIELSKNTSNYVLATSNILIGRIRNTSNYVDSTSNFLGGRIDNTSNYVFATSNILIGRVINASNYVESTSNILIGRVINASNYVLSTSNILADYNNLINKPFQFNGANIFNNSGNVGIGTNDTATYKLNVAGSLNATSLYVGGTAFTGSSQWVGTTNIYNNTGNVGIGTNDTATYKLNVVGTLNASTSIRTDNLTISSDYNSKLIVQTKITNDNNPLTTTSVSSTLYYGDDIVYIFANNGSIVVPVGGVICDIFMIGGGGGGGNNCGGGGGAGACIVAIDQSINAGSYTITVGTGGGGGLTNNANGTPGGDSSIGSLFIAKGGGGGSGGNNNATSGGCGGGASGGNGEFNTKASPVGTNVIQGYNNYYPSINNSIVILGNDGGTAKSLKGGGGGGIDGAGTNGTSSNAGTGGNGIYQVSVAGNIYKLNYFTNYSVYSIGVQDTTDSEYYIGGGGGAGGYNSGTTIAGGKGGGGNGKDGNGTNGEAAQSNTGSGGGGGGGNWGQGGSGGSGLVIIRCRSKSTTNPEIQLIRGDTIDSASTNYKILNSVGRLQIKSRFASKDTTLLTFNKGKLGIKLEYPVFNLDVGIPIVSDTAGYVSNTYFILNSSSLTSSANYHTFVCARFNGSIWSTLTIFTSSDIRIKEDIQDINDDTALQMILNIEPKTYKYIDKLNRGINKVYGFIAQQIKDVIPEAVRIQTAYIPNIYLLAYYDNNIITLPSQPTYIIKLHDKIKCYDNENKEIFTYVVEIIDDLTFKIKDIEYADTKIFIYGIEVNDFHTLDKDYIFTLNVCATQELQRRIEAQNIIIKTQEENIKKLIELNEDNEARLKRLETLLNIRNYSSNI